MESRNGSLLKEKIEDFPVICKYSMTSKGKGKKEKK